MEAIAAAAKFLWIPMAIIFGVLIKMMDSEKKRQNDEILELKLLVEATNQQVQLLQKSLEDHKIDIAKNYVTRFEIKDEIQSLHRALERLTDKVDAAFSQLSKKADK